MQKPEEHTRYPALLSLPYCPRQRLSLNLELPGPLILQALTPHSAGVMDQVRGPSQWVLGIKELKSLCLHFPSSNEPSPQVPASAFR